MILLLIAFEDYVVRFKDHEAMLKFKSYRISGVKVIHQSRHLPALKVRIDDPKLVESLKKREDILYVEPIIKFKANYMPNDPYFRTSPLGIGQWGAYITYLTKAWDITKGSRSIGIAIVDQGVDYNHPDLVAQFGSYKGYDFTNDSTDGIPGPDPDPMPSDPYEIHGTHVAGIVSATMDNNEGIAGVGNFTLFSYRVLDQTGEGDQITVSDGIVEAGKNPDVHIINLSLGSSQSSLLVKEAIDTALKYGKIIVAAAGNSNNLVDFPAAYDSVIAVGAWDTLSDRASFSDYGDELDVMAPGVFVLSTIPHFNPQGQYAFLDGTSMAAPFISGVIGLMLTLNPNLTHNDIMDIFCQTSVDFGEFGKDRFYGCGLVNVHEALKRVSQGR